MAAEHHKIPWQVLLRGIKLGGVSVGLFYFICLILIDNWSALKSKPRTWWIPGKALILSALSIQVLSYLDYSNIRFSDVPDKKGVANLLANQLMIDSGRLVICVFIGYLLPGMANRGSAEASSDIVALVVSLFTAITSELFYVYKAGKPFKEEGYNYLNDFLSEFSNDPKKAWFIVSSSIFLLAIVLLILFLVSAILAGKTARCLLKQRINSALSFNKAEECWENFDDEVLKSWLLCRAGQPQYVIARSVLSSSTGLVVTMCIVLFLAKTLKLGSNILYLHDGLDGLRGTIFVLQCVFLLLGGWVIIRRWFMAVIYFPIFFRRGIKCSPSSSQCSVEDFWTRSILELINMYDLQEWRRSKKPAADRTFFSGIFMKMFTKLQLHKFLYFLWALQKLLVWFSKCCWLFSEMFFGSMVMRRALIGNSRSLFYEVDPSVDYEAFMKYKEALDHVCMPGETPASLWLTNKHSVVQAKNRIDEGKKSELQELIKLLQKSSQRSDEERFVFKPDENLPLVKLVKDYFPAMNESWWKMAAVSLLRIIIKLDGDDKKKEAIKAYKQAWDLMSFVESSSTEQPNTIDVTQVFDFEADLVSMVADNKFKELERMHEASTSRNDARKVSEELLKAAERQLKDLKLLEGEEIHQDVERAYGLIYEGPRDSKDWNEIVPSYSMYTVCKELEKHDHINIEEIQICLTDVIADCIEQLPSILVRSFREWTIEHQEDMMWEAFYIVGKYKQVAQECGLKPKWKTSEQKVPESTEVQNS